MADRVSRVRRGRSAHGRGSVFLGNPRTNRRIRQFPSAACEAKFDHFRTRTVSVERRLDLPSLDNRVVANWIHSQDWSTLAALEGFVNYPLVREFYCNISSVDLERELVVSWVRGTEVNITPAILGNLIHLAPREVYAYPRLHYLSQTLTSDERRSVALTLTGASRDDNALRVTQGDLSCNYRLLNLFVCANVEPTAQHSAITDMRGLLLQKIGLERPVDWCRVAFLQIARYTPDGFPSRGNLPFGVLLTNLLVTELRVPSLPTDNPLYSTDIARPINDLSRVFSDAHVVKASNDDEGSEHTEGDDDVGVTAADGEPSASCSRPVNPLSEDFDDLHAEHYRLEMEFERLDEQLDALAAHQAAQDALLTQIRDAQNAMDTKLSQWQATQLLQASELKAFISSAQTFFNQFPAPTTPPK